jgi:hypothetical protein
MRWPKDKRKMTASPDFQAQLRRQLGFLERSASSFDAGFCDEGIRIATALRVIFHHTAQSTSLLTHLNAPNVRIRSKAPDAAKQAAQLGSGTLVGVFWSLASITMSAAGGSFKPSLETNDRDRFLPASGWWMEVFAHLNGVNYTRRAVVLWAANKDGGAHVDSDFPPDYQELKASGAVGFFEYADGQTEEIENAHLVFLRTMAFEVLNSPELRLLL